jgi:hypothetical protein
MSVAVRTDALQMRFSSGSLDTNEPPTSAAAGDTLARAAASASRVRGIFSEAVFLERDV